MHACSVNAVVSNVDCSPPGSSVHGIFPSRILAWAAVPFCRGSSQPRDRTWVSCVSCMAGGLLTHWATREGPIYNLNPVRVISIDHIVVMGPPGRRSEVKSFSHVWFFVTPWTVAQQAPLSMVFSRQEHWSGLPWPPPGELPDPGIEPMSPALPGRFFTTSTTWEAWLTLLLIRNSGNRAQQSVLTRWFWCMLRFENHWCRGKPFYNYVCWEPNFLYTHTQGKFCIKERLVSIYLNVPEIQLLHKTWENSTFFCGEFSSRVSSSIQKNQVLDFRVWVTNAAPLSGSVILAAQFLILPHTSRLEGHEYE